MGKILGARKKLQKLRKTSRSHACREGCPLDLAAQHTDHGVPSSTKISISCFLNTCLRLSNSCIDICRTPFKPTQQVVLDRTETTEQVSFVNQCLCLHGSCPWAKTEIFPAAYIGTWPLAVMHRSDRQFTCDQWNLLIMGGWWKAGQA